MLGQPTSSLNDFYALRPLCLAAQMTEASCQIHHDQPMSFELRSMHSSVVRHNLCPSTVQTNFISLCQCVCNMPYEKRTGKEGKMNVEKVKMFPPGLEPGTFRVLGECDNQLHHRNSRVAKTGILVLYNPKLHCTPRHTLLRTVLGV